MAHKFMTFKQFLQRRETLQLYRQFLRVLMDIDDDGHRLELKRWIRNQFEMAVNEQDTSDEEAIQMRLSHGRMALKELKTSVQLAKS